MINPTAQGNGPLKGHLEPAGAPLLSQPLAAFTQGPQIHLLGCWQLPANSCYPTVSVFGCFHPGPQIHLLGCWQLPARSCSLLSQSSVALTHGPQIHLLGCWQLQASSCYPTVSVFGCSHPVTTQLQSRPPIWNFHSV